MAEVLAAWREVRGVGATDDPQLEAIRLAILLEDVFGAGLSDADIDLAVLSDARAVHRLLCERERRR